MKCYHSIYLKCSFNHTDYNMCVTCFNIKQESQCTYNVTLRRVLVTIVAVGKQYYIFSVLFVAFII